MIAAIITGNVLGNLHSLFMKVRHLLFSHKLILLQNDTLPTRLIIGLMKKPWLLMFIAF